MTNYNYDGSIINKKKMALFLFVFFLFAFESFHVFHGYYFFNKVLKFDELSNINIGEVDNLKRIRLRVYRSGDKMNILDAIFNSENYYKLESKLFKGKIPYILQLDEYELEDVRYQIKTSKNFNLFYERRESPHIGVFFYVHQIKTSSWELRENYNDYYYSQVRFKWFSIFLGFLVLLYILKEIYSILKEYYDFNSYFSNFFESKGNKVFLLVLSQFYLTVSLYDFYGYYIFEKVSKLDEMSKLSVQKINNLREISFSRIPGYQQFNLFDILFNSNNYYSLEGEGFDKNIEYIVEVNGYELEGFTYEMKESKYFNIYYELRESPDVGTFIYVHQIETSLWKLHDDPSKYYNEQIKFKWFGIFLFLILTAFILEKIYRIVKK